MAGWSRSELRTLTALADTFVPGDDAGERARLAVARLERHVEGRQILQLRLFLRTTDSRAANLFLHRRALRFSRLGPDQREAYLHNWATSRIGFRRAGIQAWKRLLCLIAYGQLDDAGPEGLNPRLAALGYNPTREPAADPPTDIRPLAVLPDPDKPVDIDADVVVVGSGAGGGVVALELARAGRSVVIVEAGPLVTEPDMPVGELTAYDRLYLDGALLATTDAAVTMLAGACVGGGTTVNWSTCLPTPDAIRAEWATEHGLDGFDDAEFDRDLTALKAELGFAPPPGVPPKDAALIRGARALGIEAAETLRNAVGCGDCGSCGFGCPRGAKRSTLRVHLPEAAALGARLLPDATVARVLLSRGRVAGVGVLARLPDGSTQRVRVRAPQVVLAAGALRTSGLVARSGIANSALGSYLRIQPVSAIVGRYEEPIEAWRGTLQAARSLEFAPGHGSTDGSGFTIESVPAHPGILAAALPWTSAAAYAARMQQVANLGPLIAITRDRGFGRVESLKSGWSRVHYRVTPGDVAQLRDGLVQMARIARAAGAVEVLAPASEEVSWSAGDGEASWEAYLGRLRSFDFRPNVGAVFSAHQMGTARMGADRKTHPVDPRGHVRVGEGAGTGDARVRGLYVADASLMPTALGVNPMVTVMLLARRVARTVAAEASASA